MEQEKKEKKSRAEKKVLKRDRVAFLANALLDGKSERIIKTMWCHTYGLDPAKNSNHRDMWRDDLTKAYALLKRTDDADTYKEAAQRLYIARYTELYNEAVDKGDYRLAADILAKSAKILGLEVQKVEADVNSTIEVVWES